ncbi:hypothetical protein OHB26_38850 (plasmid) [Nocardia sp. NBC_01503]|uniref:hypothetical protein n=1 Tax=Nocardia sp. NBC_01503 TaxID=2975997 RepID=UPI002E7B78D8|nr:hypothetical protein [Nocardia sp. NBC_01503]WTL36638.1 hypothetical protein OHB26_38850 [Nocardia sp. NBC_01503]
MGAHSEFFARVVQDRRQQLNLSMQQVHAQGGPAAPTQIDAELERLRANVRVSTFEKFDVAMRWVPGSAAAAYREGRTPIPLSDNGEFEPGTTAITLSLDELLPLLEAQRALHTASVTDLPEAMTRLDAAVSALVGPFVTDLLERHRGRKVPLIEIAFGEALSAPVAPDDPHREERLYRRWLTGREEGLDEQTVARFEHRHQSRGAPQ